MSKIIAARLHKLAVDLDNRDCVLLPDELDNLAQEIAAMSDSRDATIRELLSQLEACAKRLELVAEHGLGTEMIDRYDCKASAEAAYALLPPEARRA